MLRLKLFSARPTQTVPARVPSSLFESASLSRGHFPAIPLAYSVLCHVIGFALLTVLSIYRKVPDPPIVADNITYIDIRLPKIPLLPTMIAPGNQGMRVPDPKPASRPKKATKPKFSDAKGFSYPGPQTIVSDPPNPTNLVQTVLQPDIENPPVLVPPIPLPNLVQVAEAIPDVTMTSEPVTEFPKAIQAPEAPRPEPPPQPAPPEPAMVMPALELAPQLRMEKPKITLAPSIPPLIEAKPSERREKIELPSLIKAPAFPPPEEPSAVNKPAEMAKKQPEPVKEVTEPKPAEKPRESPSEEASSGIPKAKDILSLTPIPTTAKAPVKWPEGEARGRFAISPEPNLTPSEKDPGAKTGISSESIGIGNKQSANDKASLNPVAVAVDKGSNTGDANTGAGGNRGPVSDRGSRSGAGSGNSGSGSGSGRGTGKSTAKKAFSGITIVGGSYEPGDNSDPSPVVPARKPLQTAYGLSIISTENSGGGLPFFGVFSHEQIYTVYLDMRHVEEDQDPSWTLEFAVIRGSDAAPRSGSSQKGLILPFPAEKVRPLFPAEVVRRHLGEMVIVYGVVNAEGKLEQVSIKDSPDGSLNEPLTKALSAWVFRPAQLNGEPVAAKLLMGIPLWLPE